MYSLQYCYWFVSVTYCAIEHTQASPSDLQFALLKKARILNNITRPQVWI